MLTATAGSINTDEAGDDSTTDDDAEPLLPRLVPELNDGWVRHKGDCLLCPDVADVITYR